MQQRLLPPLTMPEPEASANIPVGSQVGQRGVELHSPDAAVDEAVPERPALQQQLRRRHNTAH